MIDGAYHDSGSTMIIVVAFHPSKKNAMQGYFLLSFPRTIFVNFRGCRDHYPLKDLSECKHVQINHWITEKRTSSCIKSENISLSPFFSQVLLPANIDS